MKRCSNLNLADEPCGMPVEEGKDLCAWCRSYEQWIKENDDAQENSSEAPISEVRDDDIPEGLRRHQNGNP